ncbi:urophorphyrin methylase 1 [Zea mays]|uniref:uroporphyrinogen-III C-methyltransferase n=1 Tax=Zea mays TaxID=4577 RepID=A0A1D6G078_MAIZE|nr:urophorphyrin methylase 1 [Zea mays]AQK96897.1 urophorphyrin methylase 1 [Zea mays]
MALAVRTPRFQPRPASISAPATPASNSLAAAAAANARPRTCAGAAVRASPFTEATSSSRYLRDAWSYATDCSSNSASRSSDAAAAAAALGRRDDEIALQLPELQRLLDALRASRRRGAEGGRRRRPRTREGGTGGYRAGDPELLTLKAVRAIEAADLEEIHELLLSFAEAGANVVRLKGGDPLVFGRGGEEMDFLQQQGIKVEIIPGITSASGIAAELGIPLTHRGVATSVRFLTGHSRNGGTDPLYVAGNAADPDTTLVVYMGLSTLASLAPKLMKHGLPPDTPAVAVERGTTPQQRMVFALLKDLVDEVKSADLVSPTLIIIGKVVSLSPFWVESSEHDALKIESSYASEAR